MTKCVLTSSTEKNERLILETTPGCYSKECVCCTTDDPTSAFDFSKCPKEYRELKQSRAHAIWKMRPQFVLMTVTTSWELKRL